MLKRERSNYFFIGGISDGKSHLLCLNASGIMHCSIVILVFATSWSGPLRRKLARHVKPALIVQSDPLRNRAVRAIELQLSAVFGYLRVDMLSAPDSGRQFVVRGHRSRFRISS